MSMFGLSALALVVSVAGHSCNNGARVTCMAVQPLSSETSIGSGFGARGTPHCTTHGEKKVYCLVDHGYHRCQSGYQPCCEDGSNPWHHSVGSTPSDSFTCAKPTMAPSLAMASSPPAQPIILDDMDATNTKGVNAYEGSYAPCMSDSYRGQFHHDWSRNKGSASFTYTFEAPASGCYKIEERHAGGNPMCKQYMPTNAKLDIVHSYNKQTSTYSINQAIKPAQWNEVAQHMFMSDTPGKLVMRSHKDEKCDAGGCFFHADAFRLTWTGEKCLDAAAMAQEVVKSKDAETPSEVAAQLNEPKDAETPSEVAAQLNEPMQKQMEASRFASPPCTGCKCKPYQGTARLSVHLDHHTGGSEHQHVDVSMTLMKHQIILQTTFGTHFNLKDVKIVDIAVSGRRLEGVNAVNVQFSGLGGVDSVNLAADGLTEALQKAMADVKAGFSITGTSVAWTSVPGTDDSDSDFWTGAPLIALLFGVGAFAFIIIAIVAYFAVSWKRSQNAVAAGLTINPTIVAVGKTVDVDPMDPELKDKLDDLEVKSNVSTKSPESDQARSEDTNSNEDKLDTNSNEDKLEEV